MDKNKCPFSKTYSTFWKKVVEQYNILKLLKEKNNEFVYYLKKNFITCKKANDPNIFISSIYDY
jgi:hypothetical protein